eukprot:CAMPEP_0181431356 /NCGR_PEP_ID=MMETSP1110-20121109/18204_1 /TAXON_ID=174948 /ORGANISM="Symbiodinium sp., Strain CCMP421" /LENGTH=613 /DNA_ID=CAMNT_0023554715 /DNA_START=42 /DNA_END=1880 /DNA_ORIENTATION=+
MAQDKARDEDEETKVVVKYVSFVGAALAFGAAILAIFAVSMPWWTGTQSSSLLNVGLDGTETTLGATITLWDFDLELQLAPKEGQLDGEIYNLRTTWDDTCAQAERTLPNVPYCAEVSLARVCVILEAIFDSFFAAFVILASRFTPLLLLLAVGCGVIAVLFAFGAAGLGVMTSTTGLGGVGFMLLGASLVCSGLGVAAVFYAAAKAMPPPPDAIEEVRRTRMKNLQESTQREKEMAAILEENVQRRRRESESGEPGGAPGTGPKRVPVMLQKLIFYTQENEGNEEAELPMELLQAAYQEIDDDGSGSVTLVELCEALKLCGLNASEAAATTVMNEIDKNMNGTIDIHEFVMFFRTLEEMTRFQRKTQQRAQFLSYVLNFCFLLHIILVGVLLMIFIRMDEATGGDTYPILRNVLMAFSIVLVVLFLLVIGIPAARMTLGVQVAAWQHHYNTAIRPEAKFRRRQQEAPAAAAGGGVRSAAWAEGAGPAPPVNAAKYGASYRVSRMTYDNSGEQAAQASHSMTPVHMSERGELTPGRSSVAPTTQRSVQGVASGRSQGAILSKTGEFVRYDPASYRNAAMNSMARMPMSFTPMQVQNMGTSADQPGVMALTDDA